MSRRRSSADGNSKCHSWLEAGYAATLSARLCRSDPWRHSLRPWEHGMQKAHATRPGRSVSSLKTVYQLTHVLSPRWRGPVYCMACAGVASGSRPTAMVLDSDPIRPHFHCHNQISRHPGFAGPGRAQQCSRCTLCFTMVSEGQRAAA